MFLVVKKKEANNLMMVRLPYSCKGPALPFAFVFPVFVTSYCYLLIWWSLIKQNICELIGSSSPLLKINLDLKIWLCCFVFSRILSYTGALISNQTDKCFTLFCPMRGCKKLINGISVHIRNFNLVFFLEFQFCWKSIGYFCSDVWVKFSLYSHCYVI